RSEIQPRRGFTWNMGDELCAVGKMAQPQIALARPRDEVLAAVFLEQQAGQPLQPRDARCIAQTRAISTCGFLVFDHAHAARLCLRACTRIAVSAAGVIPRIRPASARVSGLAPLKRSTISRERPGISS